MTKASKLKKYLITHWEIWDMKSHYQPPQVDLSELNMFSYYLQIYGAQYKMWHERCVGRST